MSFLSRRRAQGEPNPDDIPELSPYAQAMERGLPYIELRVAVDQPLELGDFVSAFTALGAEYDRYMKVREINPDDHATLYIRDIRQGSIIADLIPWLLALPTLADGMQQIMAVEDFVKRYGSRLLTYGTPGGRVEDITKAELQDFHNQVAAIAHNPGAKLSMAAIEIVDGEHRVRSAFEFDTSRARVIQEQVDMHRYELEHKAGERFERVLMIFTRSDVRTTALGKRSGEQVKIEAISHRSMPIIYDSQMAEQAIKYEITDAEDNVYKKGFVVDVSVEDRQGRAVAYRIWHLHQVIDLPDNDDD